MDRIGLTGSTGSLGKLIYKNKKNLKIFRFSGDIRNKKEVFEWIHKNNFDIFFTFVSSGMCRIIKKKEDLVKPISIKTRENSPKNLIRNILNKYFKK